MQFPAPPSSVALPSAPGVTGSVTDRRSISRIAISELAAIYRPQGSFRRNRVPVIDFNRFGLALHTPAPLALNQTLYLWFEGAAPAGTGRVVGVVHNCVSQDAGFRCGIRFRTDSRLQQQPERTRQLLIELEKRLQAGSGSSPVSAYSQ